MRELPPSTPCTGNNTPLLTFRAKGTSSCTCWGNNTVSIGNASTIIKSVTITYKSCATAPYNNAPQYIVLTNITTGGFGCAGILPVELTSFIGRCSDNKKTFEWSTASETNNDFFIVEKSRDGIEFAEAGKIKGAGNSSIQLNYQMEVSENDLDYTYYRLKQTDFDGQFSYSNTIHVNCLQNYYHGVSLFPNPATDKINVQFISSVEGKFEYVITDVFGRTIKQVTKEQKGSDFSIDTQQLPGGVYFLRLTEKEGLTTFPALRFIKE